MVLLLPPVVIAPCLAAMQACPTSFTVPPPCVPRTGSRDGGCRPR